MDLSDRHRHFLRIEQGVHALFINIGINGLIAWLILRGHAEIPLWGEASMGVDILATSFLLPLLMCLIVSQIITRQVMSGKLPALEAGQADSRGLHRKSTLVRSLILAGGGLVCAGLPVVVMLELARAQPVALLSFVGFKALWAGGLAMLVSPILAWWALAAASDRVRSAG